MAGNKQKKSGFSLFSIFKSRRPRRWEDCDDVASTGRRVWPSDEDKGYWVAEPGIDRKASAFIAKFHEARISESERHAVYQAS
ncbi:Ribosomal protein S12 [Melia azedarach]|uniref:Ribosomal protein S12 n=1 Tax=Melia azedarach TaxID=155640 RepID=A0ACC1YED4_MELAZ|nr:Ribosomal protein S12 [Melia azedarach]